MWADGRVDVLRVDGLCLLHTVWELLFSTKQPLHSSGKSLNAEPRCVKAADREGAAVTSTRGRWSRTQKENCLTLKVAVLLFIDCGHS